MNSSGQEQKIKKDFFQQQKDAGGPISSSTKQQHQGANGPSPYMNVAQKAKLILPSALWILLIIAGVCFLTLLASLNRTLGTLDTLVELEEERSQDLHKQNLALLAQQRRGSSLGQAAESHNDNHHNQHHKHNHRNHDEPFGRRSWPERGDKLNRARNDDSGPSGPSGLLDLQFGDEMATGPSFGPGWFALPDWTSLEPARRRPQSSFGNPKLQSGHNGPADDDQIVIVASIESDNQRGGGGEPMEAGSAISSMMDAVMRQFVPSGELMETKLKPQAGPKQEDERPVGSLISAHIENLNINLGAQADEEPEGKLEEEDEPRRRKGKRREDHSDSLSAQPLASPESMAEEMLAKLLGPSQSALKSEPMPPMPLISAFLPGLQPELAVGPPPSSPLWSLLAGAAPPGGLSPALRLSPPKQPGHKHPHRHHHHHHQLRVPALADEPLPIVVAALGEEQSLPAANRPPKQHRFEPYEIALPPMVHSPLSGPVLAKPNDAAEPPKSLHLLTGLAGPDEPVAPGSSDKERQEQWNSLSSDLADSLLQSLLLPAQMAVGLPPPPPPPLHSRKTGAGQTTASPEEPETLVIVDGKPLEQEEANKLLSKVFGSSPAGSGGKLARPLETPASAEAALDQIGTMLNLMLGIPPTGQQRPTTATPAASESLLATTGEQTPRSSGEPAETADGKTAASTPALVSPSTASPMSWEKVSIFPSFELARETKTPSSSPEEQQSQSKALESGAETVPSLELAAASSRVQSPDDSLFTSAQFQASAGDSHSQTNSNNNERKDSNSNSKTSPSSNGK